MGKRPVIGMVEAYSRAKGMGKGDQYHTLVYDCPDNTLGTSIDGISGPIILLELTPFALLLVVGETVLYYCNWRSV